MPVRRGEDGTPFEEPTIPVGGHPGGHQPPAYDAGGYRGGTVPMHRPAASGGGGGGHWDQPTQAWQPRTPLPAGGSGVGSTLPPQPARGFDDQVTRIVNARKPPVETQSPVAQAASAMDDPPVGWLIVVKGPGQGRVATLGAGYNSIGRGKDERVQVDFGDETISRGSHAIIVYEPKSRSFLLQHGGGKNLTYLNDVPVLTPVPLPSHSEVVMGDTTFRFIPLCGPDFDWKDRT